MAQTPLRNLKSHEAQPSGISNLSVVFESQIPNSTLRRSVFAINTTLHPKLPFKIPEFEPNSHIFVKICENLAKMWCLSDVVFESNTTDFEWMIWVESGVICQSMVLLLFNVSRTCNWFLRGL